MKKNGTKRCNEWKQKWAETSWVAKRAMKGGKLAKEPIIAMPNNWWLIPATFYKLRRNIFFFWLEFFFLFLDDEKKCIYFWLISLQIHITLRNIVCLKLFDYRFFLNDGGITRSVNFSKKKNQFYQFLFCFSLLDCVWCTLFFNSCDAFSLPQNKPKIYGADLPCAWNLQFWW